MNRYLKPLAIAAAAAGLTLLAVSVWGDDQREMNEGNPWKMSGGWLVFPGIVESEISYRSETSFVTATGLSWPDGRQMLVTYYSVDPPPGQLHPAMFWRCHQYFDSSMQATGNECWYLERLKR